MNTVESIKVTDLPQITAPAESGVVDYNEISDHPSEVIDICDEFFLRLY